ncbi:MAG: EsaB/YukD family protein [Nocardioidaceae bacterium]
MSATIRVTVLGDAGRADLAVPTWVDVDALAHSYAKHVGAADVPRLATSAGAPLDGATTVEKAGLQHGDLVIALDASSRTAGDLVPVAPDRTPSGTVWRPWFLLLAGVSALAAAAVLAGAGATGAARVTGLVVLLACALVSAAPIASARTISARARSAVSPAFAAGAGFIAAYSDAPGGFLLGLTVAALAATVFAAVGRAFLDTEDDELVEVWLVVGGTLAVLALGLLLTGSSAQGLWSVLFAVAVVAARLLPYTVVDVPDEALLDLDRLAVTAWSAREQPRGSRRTRSMVRFEGVSVVVRRGLRLVSAGTVVIAVVVATTGPLLTRGADRGLQGYSVLAMVGLGGVALSLVARSFRSLLPRTALRLSATWVLAFLGLEVLREFGTTVDYVFFGSVTAVALLVVVTAVSLGRGWRSVWWARIADLVEGLSIVLVVAAVPLASGFFDFVRGFTA